MTDKQFKIIVNQQLDHCKKLILETKAKEYTVNNDRLLNIRMAAALQQTTMQKALLGQMAKHIIGISTMIENEGTYPLDKWTEKIGDSINYLLLLKAIVEEEQVEDINYCKDSV